MVLAEGPRLPHSGVVIRLGGFQLLLSSIGSIGTVVAEKGMYARNIVVHMAHGGWTYMC